MSLNKIVRFLLLIMMGLVFSIELPAQSHYRPIKERKAEKKEIVVATWNIGYFSNGVSGRSAIKKTDYKQKLKEYRSFIYDDLRPDIISINEYNRVFMGKDDEKNRYVTSSILFDQFEQKIVGPRKGIRKALFSNRKLKNLQYVYFKGLERVTGEDSVSYYISANITIGGKKVKLICVHLLFSNKNPGVRQQRQIEELIKKYKRYDRVIMCGDWNTNNYSLLKKAGYTLANDGSLITYPSKKTSLDNIAVKGVRLSDVRVIKTKLSDHYPIVCRITIK